MRRSGQTGLGGVSAGGGGTLPAGRVDSSSCRLCSMTVFSSINTTLSAVTWMLLEELRGMGTRIVTQ